MSINVKNAEKFLMYFRNLILNQLNHASIAEAKLKNLSQHHLSSSKEADGMLQTIKRKTLIRINIKKTFPVIKEAVKTKTLKEKINKKMLHKNSLSISPPLI